MQVFNDGRLLSDGTFIDRTDASLGVRFFFHPVLDEAKTKASDDGIPRYRDIEMVEIIIPGSKDITHLEVTDQYRQRFRAQYENFKKTATNTIEGTPLNQFPFISAAERKELEYFNVYTAEQLIAIPDGNIDRISVNGRDLIKKVKAYMEAAKDYSIVPKLVAEREDLIRKMELMQEQMQQILALKEENGERPKKRAKA